MGKKQGRSDWDEAMEATGHRVIKKEDKKWPNRLRTTTRMVLLKTDSLHEDVRCELFLCAIENQNMSQFIEEMNKDNKEDELVVLQDTVTMDDIVCLILNHLIAEQKQEDSRKRKKYSDVKGEMYFLQKMDRKDSIG